MNLKAKYFNPFSYLFFLWGMSLMLVTGLVVLCCYFFIFTFSRDKDTAFRRTWSVTHYWALTVVRLLFLNLDRGPAPALVPGKPYVIASNHLSILDIPLAMLACPVPFSFLAKAEVRSMPVIGYLAKNMHVLVNRKSNDSRRKSYEYLKNWLTKGRPVLIFIEGTRNRTRQPLSPKIHEGAFRLAVDTQTPIVAFAICRSNQAMPPGPWPGFRPWARVTLRWNEQLFETQGLTPADIPALKTSVTEWLAQNLQKH